MSNELKSKIEALTRYNRWGWVEPTGEYVHIQDVLAVIAVSHDLPPHPLSGTCPTCGRDEYGLSIPERPAVCPACKRVAATDKAQGATTFCVDPWHE